ncbi:MAG TPA: hypothetical protein PL110_13420 [Candidatus Eremiobacteraeota bacterium]|nr:MAG: hypothetical protein BWY64_04032 [bacterium ADurb.Bin363]HPZ09103.1 hypothetical protein [Candidatus Eremiobacteraeota bacterium]
MNLKIFILLFLIISLFCPVGYSKEELLITRDGKLGRINLDGTGEETIEENISFLSPLLSPDGDKKKLSLGESIVFKDVTLKVTLIKPSSPAIINENTDTEIIEE